MQIQNQEKPLSEFKFPTESGEFTGTLTYIKEIENKDFILCFFLSDKNEKIALPLWKSEKTNRFTPSETNICFRNEVDLQTVWHCKFTVSKTKSGGNSTKFLSAEMIKNADKNENFYAKNFFILLIKKAFPRTLSANLSLKKLCFSDEKICIFEDESYRSLFEICKNGAGNWLVTKRKSSVGNEKDTTVCIDVKSYDII